MSLAFYASPFETDNEQINGSSIMARKKNAAKTQKNRPLNSDRVNSLLQSIHNSIEKDSDSNDNDNDNDDEHNMFNPPSPPMSMGVQNTILKENAEHSQSRNTSIPANADTAEYSFLPSSRATQPPPTNSLHHMQMFNDNADAHTNLNAIQAMQGSAEEYYKKMTPTYGPATKQYHAHQPPQHHHHQQQHHQAMHPSSHSDNVLEKLNYMINLLEENHDERTGNVTEEVVLYSFLGIFIIFIADSFARVGKYTR